MPPGTDVVLLHMGGTASPTGTPTTVQTYTGYYQIRPDHDGTGYEFAPMFEPGFGQESGTGPYVPGGPGALQDSKQWLPDGSFQQTREGIVALPQGTTTATMQFVSTGKIDSPTPTGNRQSLPSPLSQSTGGRRRLSEEDFSSSLQRLIRSSALSPRPESATPLLPSFLALLESLIQTPRYADSLTASSTLQGPPTPPPTPPSSTSSPSPTPTGTSPPSGSIPKETGTTTL